MVVHWHNREPTDTETPILILNSPLYVMFLEEHGLFRVDSNKDLECVSVSSEISEVVRFLKFVRLYFLTYDVPHRTTKILNRLNRMYQISI